MKADSTVRSDALAISQLEQLVRLAHDDTPPTPHLIKQVELIQMSAGVARGGLTSLSPPSAAAAGVAAFFATVRDAAVSWLRDGGWAAPDTLDGIRPHVLRREDGTGRRVFSQATRPTNWGAITGLVLIELLAQAGQHLRACPACQRPFVRTGRRDYCSPACSQRLRSARHYARHRETILDQRATGYAAQQLPARTQSRRLQRIATEVRTGGRKPPQVPVARNKNARNSSKRNSGR